MKNLQAGPQLSQNSKSWLILMTTYKNADVSKKYADDWFFEFKI